MVNARVLDDRRAGATVLSGFWPAATLAVARSLLVDDPTLILVRHDLSSVLDCLVQRVIRSGREVIEDERVRLVHGCESCTLREDVLPTLVRLAATYPGRDLVLVLPEVIEPEAVSEACAMCPVDGRPVTDVVRFDSFVTVVDVRHALADLATTDDLVDRNMHAADNDGRAVATVVARQIEYADTIVMWGQPTEDTFTAHRLELLVHRLAPWATIHDAVADSVDVGELGLALRGQARHQDDRPGLLVRGIEGFALGVHEPVADCGVVSALFQARRPFHPQRLHDKLETITGDLLRSRGHLWIASQPDLVLGWEFAGGGLCMGSLGRWLVALPQDRWAEASEHRRLAAAAGWDPYYGDRHTHLAFIGIGIDPVDLHRHLGDCLLTDAELAAGEQGWRDLPDPFAATFDTPDDDVLDDMGSPPATKGDAP